MKRNVLFYRKFGGITGGDLKVWHYYNHVRHSSIYAPQIYFSEDTLWDESNPWLGFKDQALSSWDASCADVLFVAGRYWSVLSKEQRENSSVPIINLIQHIKHSQPEYPHYQYLKHKAIRICVSEEVKAALIETKKVNGPLFTIPDCIDLKELSQPKSCSQKDYDLLIAALKQPETGRELMKRLEMTGRKIEILTDRIPRSEYLEQVNRAKVTVFLPDRIEGFYLPALEGMALNTIVICPDCIANRSFCLPGYNCFQPEFNLESILEATQTALQLPQTQRQQMLDNAMKTVAEHDIIKERKAFLEILENVTEIW